MKIKYLVLVLFILLGCKQKELPLGIIPKEKMVKILINIHIVEAKVNHLKIANKDSAAAIYFTLQKEIFAKNKVSLQEYVKSYKYYRENPALMDEVYSVVVDSLSLRKNLLEID